MLGIRPDAVKFAAGVERVRHTHLDRTITPMHEQAHILALETSGRIGSVALGSGPRLHRSASFRTDHNHAVELLPTVARLCREEELGADQLQGICVSVGPGSFTGLRIAVTVARVLARSTGAGIVAVESLDVIAQNALDAPEPPAQLAVILDAKRQQVYAAAFCLQQGRYQRIIEPGVFEPGAFLNQLPQPVWVMGEGITYHRQALDQVPHRELDAELWPARAAAVYTLGYDRIRENRWTTAEQLVPLYLRLPEAEEKWRQASQGKMH